MLELFAIHSPFPSSCNPGVNYIKLKESMCEFLLTLLIRMQKFGYIPEKWPLSDCLQLKQNTNLKTQLEDKRK
jgi:hypothetical protein